MDLKQVIRVWRRFLVEMCFFCLVSWFQWFDVVSCVKILQPHSYEFSSTRGGPLLFESDLCPGLGLASHLESSRDYLSPIILQPSFDIGAGKSPCLFNVTPIIPIFSSNNLKHKEKEEQYPLRAKLLGMFITEKRDIPWPTSNGNKIGNDFCSHPLIIHVAVQPQNLVPRHDHHLPQTLCRVSNEIFMATRKVRHLQSKIWYQSSTGRLALSVDKELDFTTKMNGSAHPKTAQVSGSPIPPPTFAHLMFLFNSTGQKCFIRVEHYRIGTTSEESGCGSTIGVASCNIYPCADELRLQLVSTDLWLKRGIRRLLNHQQYKLRSQADKDRVKDDPGHPSIRLLLCAWTPVLLCIYLLCRRRNWTEEPETEEDVVEAGESGQNTSMKDLPPTYSEVLEMDTNLPPPTYSDINETQPTGFTKIFKLEKSPSFPTPTNV